MEKSKPGRGTSGWRSCLKIINTYNKLTGFGDSESEPSGICVGMRHIHDLLESESVPSTLVSRGDFTLARRWGWGVGEEEGLAFRTTQHSSKENVRT